jgi:hypothetical protein
MGGLRSNHRGIGGRVLWLAATVAQYRCKSEWTHLSLPGRVRPLATTSSVSQKAPVATLE